MIKITINLKKFYFSLYIIVFLCYTVYVTFIYKFLAKGRSFCMNYKKSIVTIDEAQRLIETSSPFYVYDEAAIAQNAPNVYNLSRQ